MSDRFTLLFPGRNGTGAVQIPAFSPGQFGARVLLVQKLVTDVSTSPALVFGGSADATGSFDSTVDSTGKVQQTDSGNLVDCLFSALVELG
jgi:hypothetical protein